MNPNRQNNCYGGRSMTRSAAAPACNQAVSQSSCGGIVTNTVTACSDNRAGGIIFDQGYSGCNKEGALSGLPVAMAYVPWQAYGNLYSPQAAFQHGTLFQELNLDFAGRRCN